MSKFYKVCSNYNIGDEYTPYQLFIQANHIDKVHRYLEDYCSSVVGENYQECLEEGLFDIKEVSINDIILVLE